MKTLLIIMGIFALVVLSAQAQCKDCGCKDKCSPKCRCPHHETPKAQ